MARTVAEDDRHSARQHDLREAVGVHPVASWDQPEERALQKPVVREGAVDQGAALVMRSRLAPRVAGGWRRVGAVARWCVGAVKRW